MATTKSSKVTPILNAASAKKDKPVVKNNALQKEPDLCQRGRLIRDQVIDMDLEEDVIFLDPPYIFDPAIIGLTEGAFEPPRLIYDAERCIEQMVLNGMDGYEEAREFFEYNTLGAYIKNGPIFVNSLVSMVRMKDEKKPSRRAMQGPEGD